MIEYWYRALEEEFGVVLTTDNPELLKAKLYAARAEEGDPALAGVSILLIEGELWLIKQEPANTALQEM